MVLVLELGPYELEKEICPHSGSIGKRGGIRPYSSQRKCYTNNSGSNIASSKIFQDPNSINTHSTTDPRQLVTLTKDSNTIH